MAAWDKVGSLRKGKTGALYVKLDKGVNLSAGGVLQLQDPRKKLKDAIASGRLNSEEGEGKIAKIPEYIKYDVYLVTDEKTDN